MRTLAGFFASLKETFVPFFLADGIRALVGWLAVILAVDYFSALLCALLGKARHGKNLSSRIGFLGILRKSLIFVVVGVAYLVDQVLGVSSFCSITIKGFIINEAISTLQNVSLLGTWIPPALKNGLAKYGNAGHKEARDS